MKINVIQSSSAAINSVYIIEDFLEDLEYLNFLTKKIEEYTLNDEMQKSTNVKASMTDWQKLLKDSNFNNIHIKILKTLSNIFTLRTPHPNAKTTFFYQDSWGMSHQLNDFTKNHIHAGATFAGSFCFKVPCFTEMYFDDYGESVELKDNMLLIFPALCKHRVSKHTCIEKRISMAFNIELDASS
jgi:hypothetical protein